MFFKNKIKVVINPHDCNELTKITARLITEITKTTFTVLNRMEKISQLIEILSEVETAMERELVNIRNLIKIPVESFNELKKTIKE